MQTAGNKHRLPILLALSLTFRRPHPRTQNYLLKCVPDMEWTRNAPTDKAYQGCLGAARHAALEALEEERVETEGEGTETGSSLSMGNFLKQTRRLVPGTRTGVHVLSRWGGG